MRVESLLQPLSEGAPSGIAQGHARPSGPCIPANHQGDRRV